jgi:hypothetical protein
MNERCCVRSSLIGKVFETEEKRTHTTPAASRSLQTAKSPKTLTAEMCETALCTMLDFGDIVRNITLQQG